MPTVTAQPRRQNNDDMVTEFIDTVGSVATTYTFPSSQNFLRIENKGVSALTLSVSSFSGVSIFPGQSWESEVDYDSFSIQSAAGSQQFNVRAISHAEVVQLSGSTARTQDSGNNAAQTLTVPAVSGKSLYITSIEVLISSSSATNDITVQLQDGTTTVWKEIIGSGAARGERVGIVFTSPIKLTEGNAANLVVSAGGVGVVTTANIASY